MKDCNGGAHAVLPLFFCLFTGNGPAVGRRFLTMGIEVFDICYIDKSIRGLYNNIRCGG